MKGIYSIYMTALHIFCGSGSYSSCRTESSIGRGLEQRLVEGYGIGLCGIGEKGAREQNIGHEVRQHDQMGQAFGQQWSHMSISVVEMEALFLIWGICVSTS